jgi:hypothetical protein
MPHELRFINVLAKGVLASVPFPSAEAQSEPAGHAGGIDESSDIFEPHGCDYYKSVRRQEVEQKEAAAREAAAPSSSEPAASSTSKAPGKRASKARKGVTPNLLNASPLKPTTAAEVELMLKCVSEAEKPKSGKKRKLTTWQIASDLYREAFIRNCAAERALIRASTTPEIIEQCYVEMAKNREFVAETMRTDADALVAPSPPPAVPALAGAAAESAPEVDESAQEAAEASEVKPKKLRGRARWHALVEGGRVLELQEATTMGQDPLAVYLRAMGVKLTREQQGDVEFIYAQQGA